MNDTEPWDNNQVLISTATELKERADSRADALDRLIISDSQKNGNWDGDVLVLEDTNLSLAFSALAYMLDNDSTARVFVRSRSYALTQELLQEASQLSASLRQRLIADSDVLDLESLLEKHDFSGHLALGRLPKSHGALADWSKSFTHFLLQHDLTTGSMILGGNTKHMNKTFNATLGQYFGDVKGLHGRGKHRCLEAQNPQANQERSANSSVLAGIGGVFSGTKADLGGQFLAEKAEEYILGQNEKLAVLDFGCGNGSVSHHLLTGKAQQQIKNLTATDIDADAIRSARVNIGSFPNVQIVWDDAASCLKNDSYDLVLLNPPFHDGTRVDLTLVQPLLDSAKRILKPGGVLLLVHNSHARYRPEIEQRFSLVKQVARNQTFTVLQAERSKG